MASPPLPDAETLELVDYILTADAAGVAIIVRPIGLVAMARMVAKLRRNLVATEKLLVEVSRG